jgi:regulator of sigma E protease
MFFTSFTTITYELFFIFVGFMGLAFLIAFHELGHFLFCKIFNIYTPSFSIGVGPTLFSKKMGSTLFKFCLIPLGGYVEIAGSNEVGQGDQTHAFYKGEDSFTQKPFWQKLLVMMGGILFNLLFAYGAFTCTFWLGAPKTQLLYPAIAIPVIAQVTETGPAATLLSPGDRIISIDGIALHNSIETYIKRTETLSQEPITLVFLRNTQEKQIIINPILQTNRGRTTASLGIIFEMSTPQPLPFLSALYTGISETHRWISSIYKDFIHLLSEKKIGEMAGPLMIVHTSAKLAGQGYLLFLLFLAVISINLAILNLIPVPILDGGQIVFHAIEALVGRPLPEKAQNIINLVCYFSILTLIVFLSWQDIVRIVTPWIETLKTIKG